MRGPLEPLMGSGREMAKHFLGPMVEKNLLG